MRKFTPAEAKRIHDKVIGLGDLARKGLSGHAMALVFSEIYAEVFEHERWMKKIPALQFPEHWNVRMRPPMMGAVVRFSVESGRKDSQGYPIEISVYLDCYSLLGAMDAPYWEMYPNKDGDPERYLMADTSGLLNAISRAMGEQ